MLFKIMILKLASVMLLLALCSDVKGKKCKTMNLNQCLAVVNKLSYSIQVLSSQGCKKAVPKGRDCADLKRKGVTRNGVYKIHPGGRPFTVYCDMKTDGGGWTVIQRRVSKSDFYRNWAAYKAGFGHLKTNFWLGNDHIHRLTSLGPTTIRFNLWKNYPGKRYYAKYLNFKVGNEASGYQLTVSGYKGNAGDSFTGHNGQKFTTKDRDNDKWSSSNCAQKFKGAWWYSSCHASNLNAIYHNGHHKSYADGVNWYHLAKHHYSLPRVSMMIRRN